MVESDQSKGTVDNSHSPISPKRSITLSLKNIKQSINSIISESLATIITNKTVDSICYTFIIQSILEREGVKYVLEFSDHLDISTCLSIRIKDKNFLLVNYLYNDVFDCECDNRLSVLNILFYYLKSTNSFSCQNIWPIVILTNFYRIVNFPSHFCDLCVEFMESLNKIIYKLSKSKDASIKVENRLKFSFISSSNLLTALSSDIELICTKKYYRSKIDTTIFMLLAKSGISISTALESYINVDYDKKNLIKNLFGTRDVIVKKEDLCLEEIMPLEHYFLILHYLHIDSPIDGLMSLKNKKYCNIKSALTLYSNIISIFTAMLRKHRKLKNLLIFQVKVNLVKKFIIKEENNSIISLSTSHTDDQIISKIDFNIISTLYYFTLIYTKYKYCNSDGVKIPVIIFENDNFMYIYVDAIDIEFNQFIPEFIDKSNIEVCFNYIKIFIVKDNYLSIISCLNDYIFK